MTTTRKKLEGNGLWESSRMMLPEHKVRINEWNLEIKKLRRSAIKKIEIIVHQRTTQKMHLLSQIQ